MKRALVAMVAMVAFAGCSVDPTDDRPGEWRTTTSPSGDTYECYVVVGYRSVTICFQTED